MEIQFRPMSPARLAREVSPGQAPTEDGQSFVEVVESLTAADQTPEKDADAGSTRERRSQNRPPASHHEPLLNATEQLADEMPESDAGDAESPSHTTSAPQQKILGSHLDLTA